MVNKNGTVVSFVQAGELWNYNRDRDEVSLVFSFSDAENTDIRNMLMQYDIKILNVTHTEIFPHLVFVLLIFLTSTEDISVRL